MREQETQRDTAAPRDEPAGEGAVVRYGEVVPARWHDEGNVQFDAWTLTVEIGDLRRTYWFQTETGARKFLAERRAG